MPFQTRSDNRSSSACNCADAGVFDANVLFTAAHNPRLDVDNPFIPCPADLAEKDWPIYKAAHACKANGLLIQPVADFLDALGHPA